MSTTCYTPAAIKNPQTELHQLVPCGKCYNCLMRRNNEIKFRVEQAIKHSPYIKGFQPLFVTFTYAPEYLPISKYSKYPTLRKIDLKKMRRRYDKHAERKYGKGMYPSMEYLQCGEYGTLGNRPHYHAIFINVDSILIAKSWTIRGKELGIVDIQHQFESGAISYTAKYALKQNNCQPIYKHVENEFISWSKGLGKQFLTPQMQHWYKCNSTERNYVPTDTGGKMSIPRFIKNKLNFSEYEKFLHEKKAKQLREEQAILLHKSFPEILDFREIQRKLQLDLMSENKRKLQKLKSNLDLKNSL